MQRILIPRSTLGTRTVALSSLAQTAGLLTVDHQHEVCWISFQLCSRYSMRTRPLIKAFTLGASWNCITQRLKFGRGGNVGLLRHYWGQNVLCTWPAVLWAANTIMRAKRRCRLPCKTQRIAFFVLLARIEKLQVTVTWILFLRLGGTFEILF